MPSLPSMDYVGFLAAYTKSLNAVLVTNNIKEFQIVKNLKI